MIKILRFTASWCNPCKMLAANLHEVNTDVSIEVIDIDSSPDIATEYRIRSVPTLVMLKEDKEIKRLIGNKSTKELREWIEND